jgi:hypothetical protein
MCKRVEKMGSNGAGDWEGGEGTDQESLTNLPRNL